MAGSNIIQGASLKALITHYKENKDCRSNQAERFETFAKEGQAPKVMVISCSDSRVDPSLILACKPGDLFVVRNVANLVPPYASQTDASVSAAVEFAVTGLGVQDIIVLGHSQCGGIKALMTHDLNQPDLCPIDQWMQCDASVKQAIQDKYAGISIQEQCHHCEQASVLQSVANLKAYPWVKQAIEAQQLNCHGWYFDIAHNALLACSPDSKAFMPLDML